MTRPEKAAARAAAAGFDLPSAPTDVAPHRGGHIHTSWVITCAEPPRYLLQAINTSIFADVESLMANLVRVTEHLRAVAEPTVELIPAADGRAWHATPDGQPWRLMLLLERATSRPAVRSEAEAAAVGEAFGRFSSALATLPAPPLAETIAAFHNITSRWRRFTAAVAEDPVTRVDGVRREVDRLGDLRWLADAWTGAIGDVDRRVAHNDAKADNVLLDDDTGRPRAVIDLDTVMPGTVLADLGDLVRSTACLAAEDETDLSRVQLDHRRFEAVIGGFALGAGAALTDRELGLAVIAAQAITFEQAVRFLTDYLEGDRYYPIQRPRHNLDRARNQLQLVDLLVAGEDPLLATVAAISERRPERRAY
jgi:N-acetylhexosamine 1-kinase